jgi:hypothetical protein
MVSNLARPLQLPAQSIVQNPAAQPAHGPYWARLLTHHGLPHRSRVAGGLVLLYAQRLSRIVRLTIDDVIHNEDHAALATFLRSGRTATDLMLADIRDTVAVAGATRYLFCIAAGASGYPAVGWTPTTTAGSRSPQPSAIPSAAPVDNTMLGQFVGAPFDGCTSCQDALLTLMVEDLTTTTRLVELACVSTHAALGGLPANMTDEQAPGPGSSAAWPAPEPTAPTTPCSPPTSE